MSTARNLTSSVSVSDGSAPVKFEKPRAPRPSVCARSTADSAATREKVAAKSKNSAILPNGGKFTAEKGSAIEGSAPRRFVNKGSNTYILRIRFCCIVLCSGLSLTRFSYWSQTRRPRIVRRNRPLCRLQLKQQPDGTCLSTRLSPPLPTASCSTSLNASRCLPRPCVAEPLTGALSRRCMIRCVQGATFRLLHANAPLPPWFVHNAR